MGKSKIVLLGIQKIYKDKEKSSIVEIVPLGVYRSCNDRLINALSTAITRVLIKIPGAIERIDNDKHAWKSLYTGMVSCFEDDDSYGTTSITIPNIEEFEEIMFLGTVINLDSCTDSYLSFWLDTPKLNPEYEKRKNKYKFPEIKPNNTYFTN